MKHLILTFFTVILCYSLFFDKKEATDIVHDAKYIHEDIFIPTRHYIFPDTVQYLALYNGINQF